MLELFIEAEEERRVMLKLVVYDEGTTCTIAQGVPSDHGGGTPQCCQCDEGHIQFPATPPGATSHDINVRCPGASKTGVSLASSCGNCLP